ncbi:MAG: hypothetical protein MUE44_16195 [Oscillatoriaceae cyanobacterium Prado104]|nr:hypothetical protein [Oscillatoriaceae cyanobacterium Prado104]
MGRFVRSRVTSKPYAQTLRANNVFPSGVQVAVAIGVSVLHHFCVNPKDKHQAVSLAIAPLDRPSKMYLST